MIFVENIVLLKSKSGQLRKVAYIAQDYEQKISSHFNFSVILYDFNSEQQKYVSCAEIQNIVSTFH